MEKLNWQDDDELIAFIVARIKDKTWNSELGEEFYMTGYAVGRGHDDLSNIVLTAQRQVGV